MMQEFDVWNACVTYILKAGGIIYAACPPGGSSFYPRCMLYNQASGKRDEPDILASIGNNLFIIEAKPSRNLCFKKGLKKNSNESDYDKLLRIKNSYTLGIYSSQLQSNYLINTNNFNVQIAIAYHSNKLSVPGPVLGLYHFIVSSNGSVILLSH